MKNTIGEAVAIMIVFAWLMTLVYAAAMILSLFGIPID